MLIFRPNCQKINFLTPTMNKQSQIRNYHVAKPLNLKTECNHNSMLTNILLSPHN